MRHLFIHTAAAAMEKRVAEEVKEKAEQEELVKVRKTLVHKATPVRTFKPLEIKRSKKKLTKPASPNLVTKEMFEATRKN